MKAWNFKVNSSPTEISTKLESAFGSVRGFVLSIDRDTNNSVTFKVRKRILYAWYMIFHNWTVATGSLSKVDTENETRVAITFTQHFLINLIIITHLLFGLGLLIAVISGVSSHPSLYILGGALLAIGIILWFAIQKKFKKDIQKFKILISEVLIA